MVAVTRAERAALAAVEADQAEANRALWWSLISRQDKARALMVAYLDKRRAADPLSTFTAQEREQIAVALSAHRSKMDLIFKVVGAGGLVDSVEQARRFAERCELERQVWARVEAHEQGLPH